MFAGRECAKALAKMSKDEVDCTADLSGLSDREFEILCDWEVKFRKKYPVVGQVILYTAHICLVCLQVLQMLKVCLCHIPTTCLIGILMSIRQFNLSSQ